MSMFLYRLGRWCFLRRRQVVLLWIALLLAAGASAATLSGPTSDSFSVPGTESQRAIDLIKERFPQAAADGATATVVLVAPDGDVTDPPDRESVARVRAALAAAPQVAAVSDPYDGGIAADGRTGAMAVTYRVPATDLTDAARSALYNAAQSARDAGLVAEVTGDALYTEDDGIGEGVGVVVAAIVLLFTLGSLIAAGLPLLVAAAALTVGICAVTAATGFVEMPADAGALALMLGIAVAIDYSLFIIFRYRQLATDSDQQEAAAQAVGRAGSAVFFAGLTVIIALAGLSVVGIPTLTQVGLAAAFTVAMAVPAALTLLPALLGFAGARVLRVRKQARSTGSVPAGTRWAGFVIGHRIPALLGATALLVIAAVPALSLRLGFPDDGTAPPDTTQRKAYDLLAAGFGPGFNGPLTVVVDANGPGTAAPVAEQVTEIVQSIGVAAIAPPVLDRSASTALLSVIPHTGPTSAETEQLIDDIRNQTGQLTSRADTRVAVTGLTAINIDSSEKLRGALIPYLALVGGLAFLLLILVFRSLLIPLVAAAGFLLSVAATFGMVVAVFQWGWLTDVLGIDSSGIIVNLLPVVLIGMVFGLAMDYQVFLVTRMREEHLRGVGTDAAIINGFATSARVVTAAAIIMISVFAGFLFSATPMVQSFGFALAVSVFFDAFIVRMTIVPAVMSLLGRWGWWLPAWLERALPEVDVEGRRLDAAVAELAELPVSRPRP